MEQKYIYHTLDNGLRVVMEHRPGAAVDHCGVAVNAGSRDETPELYGLAHFVEHTIFKGTRRRKSWHILNRMESVGGELNAYTTKEETVVYTTFPAGELARAIDLVSDLVTDSMFPSTEIDKERQVVADEIDTYLDIPSEGIFDDFDELIFAGSPLAHPILGNRDTLARFSTADCRDWLERRYTPGNMVLFYSGSEKPDRFLRHAEKLFGNLDRKELPHDRVAPAVVDRFDTVKNNGTHQAHTLMGSRVGGLESPDRYALSLLTNILGGPGMNSQLNVALREKRGLVYSIDASASLMTDCGLFCIYFGCDPEDTDRCIRLVRETVARFADKEMTLLQLDKAKRQYLGQMTVGSTNTEQAALGMARATLHRGHALTRAQIDEAILEVTPARIRQCATALDLSRLTLR